MAYTYTTYIDALKAATTNVNLTDIRTLMRTDMSNAGLAADSVDQVNFWLDQIDNANSFNRNFELMDNAGSLFTVLLGLNPPESSGAIYFNDIVVIDPSASTTGAVTTLTVTNAANTGQTASTEIPSVLITPDSRQWATGAITTQREFKITAPTYSFVGASTITNAFGLYVSAPIAGTNATITNNFGFGTDGSGYFGGSYIYLGNNLGSTSTSNYTINASGTTNKFNAFGSAILSVANANKITVDANTLIFTALASTSGATTTFTFTSPSNTGQTLSTEIPSFIFTTSPTRTWETGAITTQREFRITGPTYAFVGASTITTAATLSVTAPTAGANATITNNYAAIFSGSVGILNDLQLGSITTRVASTFLQFGASTTAKSLMNLAVGAAPTAPVDGDVWREDNTNTGLKVRINGVTKTITVS